MANQPSYVKPDHNDDDFSKRLHSVLVEKVLSKRCRYCGVLRDKTSLLSDVLEIYMLDIGVVALAQIQCRKCYKTDTASSNGAILDDLPEEMKVRPTMSDIAANHALIQHNEILHDLLELMLVAATDDQDIRREQHTGMASFMFDNARRVCEEWCRGEFAELRHLKYLRLRAETLLTLPQIPTSISPEYVEMYQMMCRTFSAHRDKVLILLDLLKDTLFNSPTAHSFMMWVTVAMMHVERYTDFKRIYCGGAGNDMKFDKGEFESVVERYLTLDMPIGVKKIPVVFVLFELPRFYHYVKLLTKMSGPPAPDVRKVFLNRSQSASYRSIDSRAEMNPSGLERVRRLGTLVWPQKHLDNLNQKNEEEQRKFYERHHSDDDDEGEERGGGGSAATKGKSSSSSSKIPSFLRRKGWEPHFRKDLLPPPPTPLIPSILLDPSSAMMRYAGSVPNPLDSHGRPREKKTIIVATVDTETLKKQGYHLEGTCDKATIITSEDGTTILEGTATAEDIQACVSKDYDVYAHQEGTGYLTFQPESTKGPTHLASVAKGYADPRQGLEGCLTQHGLAGQSQDPTPPSEYPASPGSRYASSAAGLRQDQLRKKLREKQKALRSGIKPKASQTLLSYTGLDSTSAGYLAIPFNPLVDGPLGAHVMGAVDHLKEQTRQYKQEQKRNKYKYKEPCSVYAPPPPPPPQRLDTCERGFASPSLSEAFKKTDHSAVKAYVLNKDMDLMNMLDEKGLMMPVEDEMKGEVKKKKNKNKRPVEAKDLPPSRIDMQEEKGEWSPPSSREGYASLMTTSSNQVPIRDVGKEETVRDEREGLEGSEEAKKKKKKKKKKRKTAVEDPVRGPQTEDRVPEASNCVTENRDHMTNTGDHMTSTGDHTTSTGEHTGECSTKSGDHVTQGREPDAEFEPRKITGSSANGNVTAAPTLSLSGGASREAVETLKQSNTIGEVTNQEDVAMPTTEGLSSGTLSPHGNAKVKKTARDKFKECENCHMEISDKIRVCSACKRVAYCNNNCQKEHWKLHKQGCSHYLKKDVTG